MTGPASTGQYADFYSGMPEFNPGMSVIGNDATWTPVTRDETNYTFSTNITKVSGKHEIRTGFDFVKLALNHWQPEDSNPRGRFNFSGNLTGTPGYPAPSGTSSRRCSSA